MSETFKTSYAAKWQTKFSLAPIHWQTQAEEQSMQKRSLRQMTMFNLGLLILGMNSSIFSQTRSQS